MALASLGRRLGSQLPPAAPRTGPRRGSSVFTRRIRCSRRASPALGSQQLSQPSTSLDVEESWSDEAERSMDILLDRFQRADLDRNGVIDRTELRGLLQMEDERGEFVPMSWLTEEDLDRMMRTYDADRDGVIQWEEYVKMAHDGVLLEGKLREYQQAFREADTNGDGRLGPREVLKLFKALGHPLSYDQLLRIFDEYDLDQSGAIEFAEFLRMFRSRLLDLSQILDYVAMRGEPWDLSSPPDKAERAAGLATGMMSEVQSQADLDAVLSARPDELVVLMATLTWCSTTKTLCHEFEALARHYPGAIFLRLVGNANPSAKDLFKDVLKCRTTPTFFFFRGGCLCGSYQGGFPHKLEREIRLHLYPDDMPPELLPHGQEEGVEGRD